MTRGRLAPLAALVTAGVLMIASFDLIAAGPDRHRMTGAGQEGGPKVPSAQRAPHQGGRRTVERGLS
ncbi:hypothetical protein AB0A73_11405 [Glycomyces sp. NPDC047369]